MTCLLYQTVGYICRVCVGWYAMPTKIGEDNIIDEAIGELIDEETTGFYLVTTKESGGIVSCHDDRPERLEVGGMGINAPTLKLYYHVYETLRNTQEQHEEPVTIEDVFHTLFAVHEEITMADETSVYELKE